MYLFTFIYAFVRPSICIWCTSLCIYFSSLSLYSFSKCWLYIQLIKSPKMRSPPEYNQNIHRWVILVPHIGVVFGIYIWIICRRNMWWLSWWLYERILVVIQEEYCVVYGWNIWSIIREYLVSLCGDYMVCLYGKYMVICTGNIQLVYMRNIDSYERNMRLV